MKLRMLAAVVTLCLCTLLSPAWAQNSTLRQDQSVASLDLGSLQQLANSGNASAQVQLGGRYMWGNGIPKDYAQAFAWFHKAADQGNGEAENALGIMYSVGWGVQQDLTQGLTWYRKAADRGTASGESSLGLAYLHGQGVPQDYAQALAWFRRAADHGSASAQRNLGNMYRDGEGVPQNYAQAQIWYHRAADQGDVYARNQLAVLDKQQQRVAQGEIVHEGTREDVKATERANGKNSLAVSDKEQQATTQAQPAPDVHSLADIVAILEGAKLKKVELSKDEQSRFSSKSEMKYYTRNCNKNDFYQAEGGWDTSQVCARLASTLGEQDPQTELAYLRACAFVDSSAVAQNHCGNLGDFYAKRGNIDMALAVYQHAPNCNQQFSTNFMREACLRGAMTILRRKGSVAEERETAQVLCAKFNDPNACERVNKLGASVDVAAARARYDANLQMEREQNDERLQQQQEASSSARADAQDRMAALRQLNDQVSQGGTAILNTGNEQAAAIRSIGDAKAAQDRAAAQQRLATQQAAERAAQQHAAGQQAQGTGDKFHCVGASGADSGYNNGCQLVQGTNGSSGGSPGGNSPAGVVGTSGSNGSSANSSNASPTGTASHYVAPLSASCIGQFWDPKFYNWLSFQNNCGQPIQLSYAGGISGATDDLGPGQATNTGWSKADLAQKGVFNLYICPAGYIPVDSSTDQVVNRPNQTFTCKQR